MLIRIDMAARLKRLPCLRRRIAARAWTSVLMAVAAVVPAYAQKVLRGEELSAYFLSKPLSVTRASDGATVHLQLRSDGSLYMQTLKPGGKVFSSGGSWRLNDNQFKVCMDFVDPNSTGGCFGVLRDADVDSLYTGPAKNPKLFGRVN